MKLAIMQPYFFPYMGYWQLLNYVDEFVIYDNIQYTKKGWINRNRYLLNGGSAYFTLPLESASDYLDIAERKIYEEFWKGKIINQFDTAYRKAPYYDVVDEVVHWTISNRNDNLFELLKSNIEYVMSIMDIRTKLIVSSDVSLDRSKKGEDRVIDLCGKLNADEYINPIGGLELYDPFHFAENGISLKFLKSRLTPYKQFDNDFVSALSIIDVLAFNGIEGTKRMLVDFDLVIKE